MRVIVESVALKFEHRPETRGNSILREVFEAARLLDLRDYLTNEDAIAAANQIYDRFPDSPFLFSREPEPGADPPFKPEPKFRNRF
jgi:hypothetical protein